jgi:hypothetical protein
VRDPDEVRASYADAIAYSLTAVTAFLAHLGDPNLVVLMLGDHQPSSLVSGAGSSREVPISVIAGDPGVIRRARSWGWTSGLQPEAGAPTWPMDAFRDRFLTAFSG